MEPQVKERRRYFYHDYEHLYLVIDENVISVCLSCFNEGVHFVSLLKSSIKYDNDNKDADGNSPSPWTLNNKLKLNNGTTMMAFDRGSSPTNRIAFSIASQMAKNKHPLLNSEIYAKLLTEALGKIYKGHENYIDIMTFAKKIPLSHTSIARKLELLSSDIHRQFLYSLNECTGFSIQLDGCTNVKSGNLISIFFRVVFPDCSIKEHMLACIPLNRCVDKELIYNVLKKELVRVPLYKLVSITTDGVMTMANWTNGLIARLREDPEFPPFTAFHSLLHQLTLAEKSLPVVSVMEEVEKILNSMLANKLQSQSLQDHMETIGEIATNDKYCYTKAGWFTGLMLERVYDVLGMARIFMESRKVEYNELTDINWLMTFSYLMDMFTMIDETDKSMQGSMKFIGEHFECLDTLKTYIESAVECFRDNRVPNFFPRLTKIVNQSGMANFDGREMLNYTTVFLNALNERLMEFSNVKTIIKYFENPIDMSISIEDLILTIATLHPVNIYELSWELQNLLVNFAMIASNENDDGVGQTMDNVMYPNLSMVYRRTLSYFGTTYLCESSFSTWKQIKFTNKISNKQLRNILCVSTSGYEPDIDGLVHTCLQGNMKDAFINS